MWLPTRVQRPFRWKLTAQPLARQQKPLSRDARKQRKVSHFDLPKPMLHRDVIIAEFALKNFLNYVRQRLLIFGKFIRYRFVNYLLFCVREGTVKVQSLCNYARKVNLISFVFLADNTRCISISVPNDCFKLPDISWMVGCLRCQVSEDYATGRR